MEVDGGASVVPAWTSGRRVRRRVVSADGGRGARVQLARGRVHWQVTWSQACASHVGVAQAGAAV
eukprot:3229396-Rhodomonas_salina.2